MLKSLDKVCLDNCRICDLIDVSLMSVFRGEKPAESIQKQEKEVNFADVPYEGAFQTGAFFHLP
jgi:hypothetical protein